MPRRGGAALPTVIYDRGSLDSGTRARFSPRLCRGLLNGSHSNIATLYCRNSVADRTPNFRAAKEGAERLVGFGQ